jgi:hypothetical protein
MGADMTGFQEGGHGKAPHPGAAPFHGMDGPVLPGVGIETDGGAARDVKELAEFRYRDQIGRRQGGRRIGGETGHSQMGVIKDSPSAVGIEHIGEVCEIHVRHVYIEALVQSKDYV